MAGGSQTLTRPSAALRGRVTLGWEIPLGGGLAGLYLSVVVLLPLAALLAFAGGASASGALSSLGQPQVQAALALSVAAAALVALINVLVGTALAWLLVRDGLSFPGRPLLNAAIDLPFALPTIVAGVTLLALYGPHSPLGVNVAYTRLAILLALLFVTLPFVVRAVQPVLEEMEAEAEEAAQLLGASGWTVFRRIVLPTFGPALAGGGGLAFARALGEYGSVVLLSGNLPFSTQLASVYIFGEVEQGNSGSAAVLSVVLLAGSLAILLAVDRLQRRWSAHAHAHARA
jgi:sulfate transport system permease protein